MKPKTIPLLFLITAIILGGTFFVSRKFFVQNEKTLTRAKIVTPVSSENTESGTERQSASLEIEKYETFVPLFTGETLISTLTLDINNDGYDDEVILIRKMNSQNLWLVPSLIDQETGIYKRLDPIPTEFTRTRTFSYSGMDLTGDHKTSLIYQGVKDDGNYVMEIFMYKEEGSLNGMVNIGDFTCDGTIFIQQTERSESYELSMSKGESFSVWVYKSEGQNNSKASNGQNQIQEEYKWNSSTQKYELAQTIKVTAGRLAAKELSRIQDGTVETFASFLNGLWYKTSNTDGNIRYLYFNYENKEIVQLLSDTQEVYEWEDSKLRHNGIYLTGVNADIMNLHRRFDIALTNIDEIRVTIRDDINLVIKEAPLWDGQYKKMSQQSDFGTKKISQLASFQSELTKSGIWSSSDLMSGITFKDSTYSLQLDELTESGVYAMEEIGNYVVIQFRSDSLTSVLNEAYSLEFGTKTITETVRKKTVEKVVTDYDSITFTPVRVTPTDCFSAEGRIFTLSRE